MVLYQKAPLVTGNAPQLSSVATIVVQNRYMIIYSGAICGKPSQDLLHVIDLENLVYRLVNQSASIVRPPASYGGTLLKYDNNTVLFSMGIGTGSVWLLDTINITSGSAEPTGTWSLASTSYIGTLTHYFTDTTDDKVLRLLRVGLSSNDFYTMDLKQNNPPWVRHTLPSMFPVWSSCCSRPWGVNTYSVVTPESMVKLDGYTFMMCAYFRFLILEMRMMTFYSPRQISQLDEQRIFMMGFKLKSDFYLLEGTSYPYSPVGGKLFRAQFIPNSTYVEMTSAVPAIVASSSQSDSQSGFMTGDLLPQSASNLPEPTGNLVEDVITMQDEVTSTSTTLPLGYSARQILSVCNYTRDIAADLHKFLRRKYSANKYSTASPVTTENTDASTHNVTTTTNTDSRMTNTTLTGEGGISIPAYAELEYGIHYRVHQAAIGSGGFGAIQLAEPLKQNLVNLGFPLVAKQFNEKYYETPFYQEVALMANLATVSGFATFVGYSNTPKVSVMKYYPLGALKGFIDTLTNLLIMVTRAIDYLHERDICHNDIKPDNILLEHVDGRLVAVVTDFGISTIGSNASTVAGFRPVNLRGLTIIYAAPELFYERINSNFTFSRKPCDVYATGSLILSVVTRKSPWAQ